MKFMHKFGLITGRDPKEVYPPLTDVIHKVLNDLAVDEWWIIIVGDSHTRMSKGSHLVQIQEQLHSRWPLEKRRCRFLNRSK